MTGIEAIAKERQEQIEKHGHTIEEDYKFNSGWPLPLTKGASQITLQPMTDMYIEFGRPHEWDPRIWRKMCLKTYKERLAIAGALIAAEYDRLAYEENLTKQG